MKLTNEQRMLVFRMHAEGTPYNAISTELKENHNVDILPRSLRATCHSKKNQTYVKAFREKYLAEVKAVPIANKRIRVDDLEKERVRLNSLIKGCSTKSKADKAVYLNLCRELRQIIETAREEMEKKPHLFQNVNMAFSEVTDESLHTRKQELIRKIRGSFGRGTVGDIPDPTGGDTEDS